MPDNWSHVVIKMNKGDAKVEIGDIVFLNNQWVLIRAYFDDRDSDEDGSVSFAEKVLWKTYLVKPTGFQLARVGFTAITNNEVKAKDGSFVEVGYKMQLGFAADMALRAVDAIYLKGKGNKILGLCGVGKAKQWAVRKGYDERVAEALTLFRNG